MKLLDIVEGWYDAPDYGDEEYGFRDSDLDKVKIHFRNIATYDVYALLKDLQTNIHYITYFDDIDIAYQQGYHTSEQDGDEDGYYSYLEFNEDSAETTDESIALFTQDQVKHVGYTEDVVGFAEGNVENRVLKITKENKNLVYEHFWDLIKESLHQKK
jgi:hypothetical protein